MSLWRWHFIWQIGSLTCNSGTFIRVECGLPWISHPNPTFRITWEPCPGSSPAVLAPPLPRWVSRGGPAFSSTPSRPVSLTSWSLDGGPHSSSGVCPAQSALRKSAWRLVSGRLWTCILEVAVFCPSSLPPSAAPGPHTLAPWPRGSSVEADSLQAPVRPFLASSAVTPASFLQFGLLRLGTFWLLLPHVLSNFNCSSQWDFPPPFASCVFMGNRELVVLFPILVFPLLLPLTYSVSTSLEGKITTMTTLALTPTD